METHAEEFDQPIDAKRPKMEAASSTSPKFKDNNDESPILLLPVDLLAKIIAFIPTAQWLSLDLLRDFQDATQIAWRDLRNIDLKRGLLIIPNDRSSLAGAVEYLVNRSPFLTSLSGIDLRVEPNSDVIRALAKFEHLQSITMGDAQFFEERTFDDYYEGEFDRPGGVRLDALVEFLETTRSRSNLKQLQLFNVKYNDVCDCVHFRVYAAAILDRFHSSMVNMRELGSNEGTQIRRPFKLEKFSFSTSDSSLFIRLDTLDSSRLTDLRLGETNVGLTIRHSQRDPRPSAHVEPVQLASLIERAPNLRRIELLLGCGYNCRRPQLQENKQLLAALANHKSLSTIKFDFNDCNCGCLNFAPDFAQMLKSIGHRGQFRKLVLPYISWDIDRDEIYSTIHECIPYLRSIKVRIADVDPEIVSNITGMPELEEVHFSYGSALDANAITKISQLRNLKRLAIPGERCDSLERLANATTLTELRIRNAQYISADIFEKWSEAFGSNLQILMLRGYRELESEMDVEKDDDEDALIRLLEVAVRLRILILHGIIGDRSMMAIAKSCPGLEILGVRSTSNEITARALQEVVNRCTKLRRLGRIHVGIRRQLKIPKYRKIGDVNIDFSAYDFDDRYYE